MDTKIIRGGRLLDIDKHEAPYRDILVRGDEIAEIGPPGLAAPEGAVAIDATGRLMHPGLMNGHTHSHGNLSKGVGERWTLELLLTAGPYITGGRNTEEKYISTLIGASEMLLKGCIGCYDLMVEFPTPSEEGVAAVAQAYADAGMRAVVAPMVADTSFFEAIPGLMDALPPSLQKDVERLRLSPYQTTLDNLAAIVKGWSADRDVIRPAMAPTIPLHCSDEFMLGCRDIAREHGLGLHSHVSESKVQNVVGLKVYGKSLTAHIDGLGLLGPDFTVAHGVWLDDDDMKRLGDKGASVSHNPGSNALLGNGIADARRMLELGVNLAIGTDGANCCDHQNMYESMRVAAYVSHVRGPEWRRWLKADEILKAATVGSARALGFEKCGKIQPGYKADIVFLDLGAINWIPMSDPVNQLVHTEDGSSVHSVMVGGRMVVENRRVLGVDLVKLAADAEKAHERLQAVNQPNKALYDQLEGIVGSFCPGLARTPHHVHRFGAPPH